MELSVCCGMPRRTQCCGVETWAEKKMRIRKDDRRYTRPPRHQPGEQQPTRQHVTDQEIKSGSRASTALCPKARGSCIAKSSLAFQHREPRPRKIRARRKRSRRLSKRSGGSGCSDGSEGQTTRCRSGWIHSATGVSQDRSAQTQENCSRRLADFSE